MKVVILATSVVVSAAFVATAFAAQPEGAPAEPGPAPQSEAPAPEPQAAPAETAAPQGSEAAPAPPPPPLMVRPKPAPPRAAPEVAPLPATAAPPEVDADAEARARADQGPIESRFNVRLDLDTVWNTSGSFDIVSDRDTSVYPGIAIGYAVLRSDRFALVPELGFSGNHTTSSALFGGAVSNTNLTTLDPYAGLSARWALLPLLDLAARVSGGASVIGFDMDVGSDGTKLSDDHVAPFLTVGGGFTLRTFDGAFETKSGALRSLVAGLGVEAGYVFAGSVDLTPATSGDGRIRTQYLSLGTLERSGPYLKTSLTARF
ncbi:MAG TPA: hypothetical protein VHC69_16510 [Polyangiaceae bacterium]|nr:hypothetical protein [Polyangiaceae bacterium]